MFLALFSAINIFPLKKKSLSRVTGLQSIPRQQSSHHGGQARRSQGPTTVLKSTSFRGYRRGSGGTGRSFLYWSKCHQHQGSLTSHMFSSSLQQTKEESQDRPHDQMTEPKHRLQVHGHGEHRSKELTVTAFKANGCKFYISRTENTIFKYLSGPILNTVCKCPLRWLDLTLRCHLEHALATDMTSTHSNQYTIATRVLWQEERVPLGNRPGRDLGFGEASPVRGEQCEGSYFEWRPLQCNTNSQL